MLRSAQKQQHGTAVLTAPVLYSRVPDIAESRDSGTLLVWGDLPYWAVVDSQLDMFLKLLRSGSTLHDAARTIAYARGHTICSTREQLRKLLPGLVSAGVVFRENDFSYHAPATEDRIENITVNMTPRTAGPASSPSGEATPTKLIRFLKSALPFASENPLLRITCGEPAPRKEETVRLARWAADAGCSVVIAIDPLSVDREFAAMIADCIAAVEIAIEGPTHYEHETLHGRGTFTAAKNAVRLLSKSGVKVVTKMLLHKDNQWRLEEYFHFSKRLGAKGVRFTPARLSQCGRSLQPPDLLKLMRSVTTIFALNKTYRAMAHEDWFTNLASTCRLCERRTSCGAGTRTVFIDADDLVYPCPRHLYPEFALGTVNDTFRKVWTNSPFLDGLRKRIEVDNLNRRCANCALRYWCRGGCRAEVYALTGSCLEPLPNCSEVQRVILEMFWALSEMPNFKLRPSLTC